MLGFQRTYKHAVNPAAGCVPARAASGRGPRRPPRTRPAARQARRGPRSSNSDSDSDSGKNPNRNNNNSNNTSLGQPPDSMRKAATPSCQQSRSFGCGQLGSTLMGPLQK